MKKCVLVTLSVLPTLCAFSQGNVGIGRIPDSSALLHVGIDSNLTKGVLVSGIFSESATVPNLNAGSRLMFYPGKGAFRAGIITEQQWNNPSVGFASAALGINTTASGQYSMAIGFGVTASGLSATAMGAGTKATGAYSTAIGINSTASGEGAIAFGGATVAGGSHSSSIGIGTISRGFGGMAIGMLNDPLLVNGESSETPSTPLFMVGNGNSAAERSNAFVVRKDGHVGVGNIVPDFTLDVANRMRLRSGSSDSTAGLWFNTASNNALAGFIGVDAANNIGIYNAAGGWSLLVNPVTGNMGLGTAPTAERLRVNGNICATGTIASCSDIRYKTDLVPVKNALLSILQLQPIYYSWKKEFVEKGFGRERQIGFSAQEVEQQFPEIVQTGADGYKAVDYSRMTPVLVQAMKELKEENDNMKEELKVLKQQMAELLQAVKK